ncbi:hypothetical protein E5672_10315 [Alteromonas portus]|uniref:Uncharacterized protein n=1 Tax=Alteromonas portus TaxID=2565549 RepID=A0A4U0ZFR0_9ALTE|nr:hypothetical protein [Alteromonas portus]TKB03424.1 hypothetical protein E5672_10315 [Alteromonas portus]
MAIFKGIKFLDKLNKVIHSKESKTGIAIQIFGAICFFAAMTLLFTSTKSNSPTLYLFFAGFFSFSILLWVIGAYQKRKFYKLGKTPLTLTPSICTIGEEFKGSIEIEKPNFNRVKIISITLWHRTMRGDDSRKDIVWESSATTHINHVDGKTILNFCFAIPHGMEPTNKAFFSENKYFWEASFEFVESMQSIKRTWEIPVKI